MSILCAIFGHRQVKPFKWGDCFGEYAVDVRGPVVDGIGRQHFTLIAACPRCGERYTACKIHGSWITRLIEQEPRPNGQ